MDFGEFPQGLGGVSKEKKGPKKSHMALFRVVQLNATSISHIYKVCLPSTNVVGRETEGSNVTSITVA